MEESKVRVLIEAEDEENRHFEFRAELPASAPIRPLQKQWAVAYSIDDEKVVGFEDDAEAEVDLDRTPLELGWKQGAEVRLWAVPLHEQYMDKTVQGGAAPQPNKSAAKQDSATPPTATRSSHTATKVAKAVKQESSRAGAAAANSQDTAVPQEPPRKKAKSVSSHQEGPPAPAPKKEKREAPVKKEEESGATGLCPQDDEPVIFEQVNPKRAGTTSYERYEKYKKATTPRQALALGAAKGDIVHDFKRGFLHRA